MSSSSGALTAAEIGFLAGGPGRAAEAALARLLDAGLVRVSRAGIVSIVSRRNDDVSAVEASVLSGQPGRRIDTVLRAAKASLEVQALEDDLVRRGYLRRLFGKRILTSASRAALRNASATSRVESVALHGFLGTVNGLAVAELFDLPADLIDAKPDEAERARGNRTRSSRLDDSEYGCGGGTHRRSMDRDGGGCAGSGD